MCFYFEEIEMLVPSALPPKNDLFGLDLDVVQEKTRLGGPGRSRTHDWEGAIFYLIGQAELNEIAPDPNALGAQAHIKKILADWFSQKSDRIPSESQLESYAKRALDAIRAAKP